MKTSKEMADAVLRKRDAIEIQRRKRNIIIKRSVIAGMAACAAGFAVFTAGKFSPEKPDLNNAVLENTVTDTVKPKETTTNGKETVPSGTQKNDEQKSESVSEQAVTDNTNNTEKAENNEITSQPSPEKTPQTEEKINTPLPSPSAVPETVKETVPSAAVTPSVPVTPSPEKIETVQDATPETEEHVHESEEGTRVIIPVEKTPAETPEEGGLECAPSEQTETHPEEQSSSPSHTEESPSSAKESLSEESPSERPLPTAETESSSDIPVTAYTKVETLSGAEYYTGRETVPPENTGDLLYSVKAGGIYNGTECMCEADAYQINDRPESEALAVKFDENDEYYLFVREH